jgi:hypothetical protein
MSRTQRWSWATLLILTLATRLVALNAVPLTPTEALEAVSAMDAARGNGWPVSADSPFLLVGNALLFLLFGPGDGIARLLPALAGIGLVFLPFLWRKYLGEIGAIVASGLLLISPLVLFTSRRAESATVGALGAGLLLTALAHMGIGMSENRNSIRTMALGAFGLILGLTGGAVFYDALLGGLAAWGVYQGLHKASQPKDDILTTPIPKLKRALAIGIGGALLLSAGLGLRWGGWLNLGEGLAAWLSQWRTRPASQAGFLLLFYEPLLIVLAVPYVWHAIRHAIPLPLGLMASALTTLVLSNLRPGAPVSTRVAALLPIACLAGWTVQMVVAASDDEYAPSSQASTEALVPRDFKKIGVGLHIGAVFILWMHAGLALARYSLASTNQRLEIVLIVLTILIQGLLVMGMIPLFNLRTAWQGFLRGSILTLLVIQVSFAWGLGFMRPADPVELAVQASTSPDLQNMLQIMEVLAIKRGWRKDNTELTLVKGDEALTAVLRWTLRDYPNLQVLERWPDAITGFVITSVSDEISPPDAPLDAEADWRGMTALAITRAAETRVTCATEKKFALCPSAIKWYLYRKGNIPPQKYHVRLWVLP